MANTFLCARGFDIGESLAERDLTQVAREVEARAAKSRCRILLPEDAVVAPELKAGVQTRTVPVAAIPRGEKILDIGPASVAAVKALLEEARSLVWNGPVGAFETPPFDAGTLAVARKALPWVCSTPLGAPRLPEVNMIASRSAGRTAASSPSTSAAATPV